MNNDKPNPESSAKQWTALGVAIVGGILAALLRVVPHPPNFSGVGGLGIFGGARLRGWQAYVLPLAIMILSDLCLWIATNFDYLYSLFHISRVFVYAGFMGYVLIGRLIRNDNSLRSVWIAATCGGVLFFVITNFCEWLFQPLQSYYHLADVYRYSRDWNGLVTCFAMALGFYQQESPTMAHPFMMVANFPMALLVWTVLGDLFFSTLYAIVYAKLAVRTSAVEVTPVQTTNA